MFVYFRILTNSFGSSFKMFSNVFEYSKLIRFLNEDVEYCPNAAHKQEYLAWINEARK